MARENDGDVLGVVQRALRRATPELRTCLMECVVDEMISHGEFGSIFLWQGILSEAVEEYLARAKRAGQQVCGHCFDNLGDELKRKLKGKVTVIAT